MQELNLICEKLAGAMRERGYSASKLDDFRRFTNRLTGFAARQKSADAEIVLSAFAELNRRSYLNGRIASSRYHDDSNAISRLRNVLRGEEIVWRVPHLGATPVSVEFAGAIDMIVASACWTSEAVMRNVASAMRQMFAWCDAHGVHSVSVLDRETVLRYYVEKSAKLKFVKSMRYALGKGLSVAKRIGLVNFECSAVFRLRIPTRSRLHPAVSDETVAKVLGQIDTATETGCRDYAMILLGADTGMRPVDVVNLKLRDIDWKHGTVNIVQRKTAHPLGLPISEGVSDAIRSYILNVRPRTSTDFVFVSTRPPRSQLRRSDPGKRFVAYAKSAGIDCAPERGVTFYGMRRRIGRNLASGGVPVPTIAQVLGHRELRSSESYMALSPSVLAECALDFTGIGGVR